MAVTDEFCIFDLLEIPGVKSLTMNFKVEKNFRFTFIVDEQLYHAGKTFQQGCPTVLLKNGKNVS